MKCLYCQGHMTQGVAPFHIDRKGYHLTLNIVPAWICQQCGEVYFEEREIEAIQETVRLFEQRAAQNMLLAA